MKARLAALLFLCATFVATAPAGADVPRQAVSIEGVTEYRLANGLRVLTVPDPSADTVTVHITYFVGSRHEGYGEKGMAHLLEHMLFKGSTRFPDIKPALVKHGARYNGTTSNDRTTYFETLTASDDNLDFALALEADRMVHSFVKKSDLDSEMTVVRNEFEMGENNPSSVLYERMLRLAFPFHNYGNPVIGVRSDIEQVPIERLQAFYRLWYQPDNALLIIGGRFDQKKALAAVAKYFGALPAPKRALPTFYTAEATQDGERSVTLRRAGDVQIVSAMYRVPSAGHPDYPAIDLLVHALGTVPSGRLHRAIVQKGLASSTFGYERMLHDPGFATFGAVVAKDGDLEPARAAVLGVTEGKDRAPITDGEVERARTALLNDMEKAQLDSAGLVRWLSEFAAMGDWRLFFLYRDRLRKVTTADVQRVFQTYLKPANRVLGEFKPTDLPERAEIPPPPDLSAALATYRGSDSVAAGEAFDPSPANIEKHLIRKSLANGMSVALLPKKTRGGNVNLSLSLYWGDESTKEQRATACALASGMLMRGTKKHTRAELRDAFERLSANASIGAGGATLEVRRPQLEETLKLVAEVLREPAFPPAEFEELKRAMLVGAEGRRGDPSAIADEQLTRYLNPYPKGHWNYPLTTDETVAALKSTTLEEAKSCYTDLVGGTGAQVVAVGDFDPDALMRELDSLLGDWKNPSPYKRIPSRFFARDALERTVVTPDKANAVLRGGLNIELRDDSPDFPAMVLGSYLLGGTSSARLPMRVREKEGLSYSTYAYFTAGSLDATALFGVSSIYAPQNRDRVEQAIREELSRALEKGFTDAEVEEAKKSLLQARRIARAQDRSLLARLSNYLYLGRTFAWDIEFEKRIAALTPAEVRDALRRYIDPKKISVLKAGDFKKAD
ncbi:MAG TPA: pitrilysin family protein [Burkholderiales bacterium]|jgi:zinc protease|nr:pitrilysin family protein [Burkholderiales bacterium]